MGNCRGGRLRMEASRYGGNEGKRCLGSRFFSSEMFISMPA